LIASRERRTGKPAWSSNTKTMNDKTHSHVIDAMEYINKPIQTIPQPLPPALRRILNLRGDRHKSVLWTVRRSKMVVNNLLDDVLTDLYSDYFIYLINRYQLSEINITCSEDVRGQFSKRWRTGMTAIHTYHQLNPDCKIIKPSISIERAQQEHHESAFRGWVAFLVWAFSKPTTINCYHSCGGPR